MSRCCRCCCRCCCACSLCFGSGLPLPPSSSPSAEPLGTIRARGRDFFSEEKPSLAMSSAYFRSMSPARAATVQYTARRSAPPLHAMSFGRSPSSVPPPPPCPNAPPFFMVSGRRLLLEGSRRLESTLSRPLIDSFDGHQARSGVRLLLLLKPEREDIMSSNSSRAAPSFCAAFQASSA